MSTSGSAARLRVAARAGVLSLVVAGTVAFVQVDHAAPTPVPATVADMAERGNQVASRAADREAVSLDPGGAVTVTVELDSGAEQVDTTAADVAGLLSQLGVVLEGETFVSSDLDDPVEAGMTVRVRSTTSKVETVTEDEGFDSEEIEDPNLAKGTRIVERKGQRGSTSSTYVVRFVDGQEVGRTPVTTMRVAQAQDEVVRVGTMKIPDAASKVLSPGEAKALAKSIVAERGMDASQYACLEKLWTRESGWRVKAANSSSGAYGIPQALPGTKMGSVASDWRTNARTQIVWGLGYIKGRYGTPCGAWGSFQAKGWY